MNTYPEISTKRVEQGLRSGNKLYTDRLVGKIILIQDLDSDKFDALPLEEREKIVAGRRRRIGEVPLCDFTNILKQHRIYIGASKKCDLKPYHDGNTLDPDAPEDIQGHVYAELEKVNSRSIANILFVPHQRLWLSDGTSIEPGETKPFTWSPGEHELSYIGFSLHNGLPRYQIRFIPQHQEDIDVSAKKFSE